LLAIPKYLNDPPISRIDYIILQNKKDKDKNKKIKDKLSI
jgi:hypothetical protein